MYILHIIHTHIYIYIYIYIDIYIYTYIYIYIYIYIIFLLYSNLLHTTYFNIVISKNLFFINEL